jgi:hypothetical protein
MPLGIDDLFWQKEAELLFDFVFPIIVDMTKKGAKNGIELLATDLEIEGGIDWQVLNQAAIDWAKKHTAEVVAQITKTSMEAFVDEFPEWYESGEPLEALIQALEPTYGRARAEWVGVTETTRTFAEGNILAWAESGLVSGIKWQTAQDEDVCPVCIPLANQEGTLDGGVDGQVPPAHVMCRCWLYPVVSV